MTGCCNKQPRYTAQANPASSIVKLRNVKYTFGSKPGSVVPQKIVEATEVIVKGLELYVKVQASGQGTGKRLSSHSPCRRHP